MLYNLCTLSGLANDLQRLTIRSIQTTGVLAGAPKKKKKTDLSILQARIERKQRKFERLVEQLEAREKIKIPLSEYTIDKSILANLNERKRNNADRLIEIRNELDRLNVIWSLYKGLENKMDAQAARFVLNTKLKTLKALHQVSPKLYENALMRDRALFPFRDERIIKETIAQKTFQPSDGQVTDVTKVWKIEI